MEAQRWFQQLVAMETGAGWSCIWLFSVFFTKFGCRPKRGKWWSPVQRMVVILPCWLGGQSDLACLCSGSTGHQAVALGCTEAGRVACLRAVVPSWRVLLWCLECYLSSRPTRGLIQCVPLPCSVIPITIACTSQLPYYTINHFYLHLLAYLLITITNTAMYPIAITC